MAYDKNKNYQEEISKAISNGDYATASVLEKERNEKIDAEGLSFQKTNNYAMPNGVSGSKWNASHETFKQGDSANWDSKTNNAFDNLNKVTSEPIISDSALKGMNAQFQTPSAVVQADAWLSQQLQQIQSGKTSYSDDVRNIMDKIMNREKFSYDVDKDPLFQQALASATNSGKTAMQDTIGQASALTGGYGSSYATSAGNQAYNSLIEDAYNNLPQYYQMALEAYQMEGDELYRQYGMFSEQDDKEYNRNLQAYDATYQHRNRMYDEAYGQFRDNKSDSFALANLQLNEHGQRVNDAYNLYNATSDQADKMYEREYTTWADKINMLYKDMEMLNTDWWNQTNFDEGVRRYEKDFDENVRQYEKNFDENVRQFDTTFAENQRQFNATLAEQQRQHNDQMSYNWANLNSKNSGDSDGSGKLEVPKVVTDRISQMRDSDQIDNYLGGLVATGVITEDQSRQLQFMYAVPELKDRRWEMVSNGGKNGGGGIDYDGIVKDEYGTQYTLEALFNALKAEGMTEADANAYVIALQRNLNIAW